MFTKLPNHLRPFLGRIPTASPDLFTPNPSLLHHLPQNGSSSHGLVAQTQSHTQASGSAGSTGRAGYQGGSAGSGGYSGHARAFTSLQHPSDPSTGIRDDDKKRKSKRRESISFPFRPPYHRAITVIEEPISLASRLRLLQSPLKAVEVDEKVDCKELSPVARRVELDNVVDETIKVRSRSTLDLYQVGIPRPRLLRAYSTTPKTLSAPNRIQMDLAGMDIPSKRHQSTATATTTATDDQVDYPTTTTDETDRRIYSAIYHATKNSRRDFCNQLIAHYRSPRSDASPHPELESHLPRPEGYTVGTYNICLEALLSVRRSGESIAPLLEIYNEMLEREILPNGRTHVSVIKALCLREKDVQAAIGQEEQVTKWAKFKYNNLGLEQEWTTKEDKAVLTGYLAEGNFESAYNLFSGIKAVQEQNKKGFYRFNPQVYNYLLDSLAIRSHPYTTIIPTAMEIFNHAVSTDTASHRMLYKHMFKLLAKTNDQEAVTSLWARFESEAAEGQGRRMRDWKDILPGAEIEERESQVEGFQREVWNTAIKAFVQVGLVDKGLELFGKMMARQGQNVDVKESPRPKEDTFGSLAISLAERGEYEKSAEIFNKALEVVGNLRPVDLGQYLDALAHGGQWLLALDTYLPILQNAPEDYRPDSPRIKRIYASLLGSARQSPEALEHVPRLMSTGTYLLEPDLAITHIRILLQQKTYAQIPDVLNNFGPMNLTLEKQTLYAMRGLLAEIVTSQIPLRDLLDVLQSFARQRIHISTAKQAIVAGIIEKYISARPTTLSQGDYSTLLRVFAKTNPPALDMGEYDDAFEIFLADVAEHAPDTLKKDEEGRLVHALAGKLFGRFGSERTTLMLNPLIGEERTTGLLAGFYEAAAPELNFDSSPPASEPQTPTPTFTIDESLSRRIDMHTARPSGRHQISPQRAYIELRSGLGNNLIPHPDSITRLMQTLSREGDEPRVLELYNLGQSLIASTRSPKLQAAWWRQFEDTMLIAQCHLGHLEQAGLHRHRLVERGMSPSADAYATMISSSKDTTDDAQVARELWEESVMMGVRPHLYLYNTVISKLSKARKAELALEMFGQMKERGVRPSSVTYGAVINACCRVGDAESAELLFDEMSTQPSFKPRVPPYNTMMQFYLQTRPNRERVLHYYTSLRESGVQPSAHTYKLLLDAYHTLPPIDLTQMERTFAELVADTTLKVQGTHWASLITAYGISAGDVNKALEVFDLIPTHPGNKGGKPLEEPVVWEAILNVLATKGSIQQMEDMRSRMMESGARPTAYVYNVLISGYARHGQMTTSREVFESMSDTYTGMSAPNNHPSSHRSIDSNVYREPSTYEVMIRAELSNKNPEKAEEVLRRMEERGYPAAVFFKARSLLDGAGVGAGGGGGMGGYYPVPVIGLEQAEGQVHGQTFAQG